ncbi:2-oxoacid:acceptor oxidoreductase family protein [Alicyclobacillus macrosporangiidus]|jgi:pyruvate ferredoxin oxidoreductase gamma subunit|uniref:Pyruvate ferredoxin oxidoreductase gamma subunit n=1 Tax=Alicyclobacillus macrosporangiidus TaxID=392015 RepID=A0A1I7IVU9_9BACL|nr:2-oxoacid:acceptor oxidoreductase family protein [Alicyclobacillus macrosporangiidus]SFU77054.1 pyruvate ferredoxin oxidoreductase gamma subunit [Alicyclobacillus macrosporangiidus]
MKQMTEGATRPFLEIRMESIGGLGANLAGKILSESGVLRQGWNGWYAASYGSEKKGTPVKAFVRFAPPDVAIRGTYPVDEPDVVAVFHEALLRNLSTLSGLRPGGTLLVNTKRSPADIREQVRRGDVKIACVDALGISVREGTRINTAMLGALCHVVPQLDPEAVREGIAETFSARYQHLLEANLRTFEAGRMEVVEEQGSGGPVLSQPDAPTHGSVLGYATQYIGGAILSPGNSVVKDLSVSRQGFIPALDLDSCIHCAACDQVCPDACFVWETRDNGKGRMFQYLVGIDYQYCKGCQKCVVACPTHALSTIPETEEYVQRHRVPHRFWTQKEVIVR